MKKFFLALPLLALLVIGSLEAKPAKKSKSSKTTTTATTTPTKVEYGKTLPAWSEGCLDIHFINSGRGECCFYILPDGTTLLVDAGEVADSETSVPQRPNAETKPYITYARYIQHFLPEGKKAIDYCAPSHFHTDHIGSESCVVGTAAAGYRKSGLLALYDEVPYKHILDRAYPNYTQDEDTPSISGQLSQDWAKFVTWGVKKKKFSADRFRAGEEQIKLVHNPKAYQDFSVFNICANGCIWNKTRSGESRVVKIGIEKGGNPASCGFHIRYGAFDYIACGDLVSSTQNRLAYYFRNFVGVGKLDAFKANHHLAANSWGSKMQECNFNPRVVLNHSLTLNKPDVKKLMHVLPVVESFFTTNLHKDFSSLPEVKANKLADRITAYDGHIVLRVMPGGKFFYVYMLDDTDFEYRVKYIVGPYHTK